MTQDEPVIRDFEALKGKKWEEATEAEKKDWLATLAELNHILNPPWPDREQERGSDAVP
ncbi:hypothetical protein [Chelativorans sp.]|uniref:hypothetical protein n=1 Tax=Chelativorans sp. TaxID=2203393 RepID=UPI002810AC50|nr:hypothetical protein [Chelativorans sp.]